MLNSRLTALIVSSMVLALNVASGQDYPNRPIHILTAPAGGSSDNVARSIAQAITESTGQQVIVDNRTNVVASETGYKAPPDGYTLVVSSESLYVRPLLEKTPYDIQRDFAPVSQATREVYVIAVHPSLPVKTVRELLALAKAKPGQLNYGSALNGSGTHLAAALFTSMANVNIVQVAYKGIPQALTGLLGGEVNFMFGNPSLVGPHEKTGRLRIIAVTAPEPTQLAPGVPTVSASGVPGYSIISLQGLWVPIKTPAAVINRLNQEVVRLVNQPSSKEKFQLIGSEGVGSSPEQFAAFIASDITKFAKLIKDANIKAD
jgi:tripartite-type tricarboxylate transporter receptor subunit TctC